MEILDTASSTWLRPHGLDHRLAKVRRGHLRVAVAGTGGVTREGGNGRGAEHRGHGPSGADEVSVGRSRGSSGEAHEFRFDDQVEGGEGEDLLSRRGSRRLVPLGDSPPVDEVGDLAVSVDALKSRWEAPRAQDAAVGDLG